MVALAVLREACGFARTDTLSSTLSPRHKVSDWPAIPSAWHQHNAQELQASHALRRRTALYLAQFCQLVAVPQCDLRDCMKPLRVVR